MTSGAADGLIMVALITAAGVGFIAYGMASNVWIATGCALVAFPASMVAYLRTREAD